VNINEQDNVRNVRSVNDLENWKDFHHFSRKKQISRVCHSICTFSRKMTYFVSPKTLLCFKVRVRVTVRG